ncbi:MAG: hypothetical protein FWG53_04625 [Clostridiales bacterium]|nr:hypothetical protein [Clostridiales bacterium]
MTNEQIEEAVKQFESDFQNGSFVKNTSPNDGKDYHRELEAKDHEAFEVYIGSDFFKFLNRIDV